MAKDYRYSWAIGMTTASRKRSFLYQTLDSLEDAGWPEEAVLLKAEPFSLIPPHDVAYHLNTEPLGAYANWRELLQVLAETHPEADFFVTMQDDVVLWKGLRSFLESSLSPGDQLVCQPYAATIERRTPDRKGWYRCFTGRALCGAYFFVYPNAILQKVLSILPTTVPENKHIDGYLAQALNDHGVPFYQHIPSLLQHLGDEFSTLGYQKDPYSRTAPDFIGQDGVLPAECASISGGR
jgi:hypothetical protein